MRESEGKEEKEEEMEGRRSFCSQTPSSGSSSPSSQKETSQQQLWCEGGMC